MDFHPDHDFDASISRCQAIPRTLTGPPGGWISRARLDALRLQNQGLFVRRIGFAHQHMQPLPSHILSVTGLCPFGMPKSGYITIVRENQPRSSPDLPTCAAAGIWEPPFLRGAQWPEPDAMLDSLTTYGSPHPRCPGSRWMGSLSGPTQGRCQWPAALGRGASREQSRPRAHVTSSPPPGQNAVGHAASLLASRVISVQI